MMGAAVSDPESLRYNSYNLHDHISVCWFFLEEQLKSSQYIKYATPAQILLSEIWHYDNAASAPPAIIETFKYQPPSRKSVNLRVEDQ